MGKTLLYALTDYGHKINMFIYTIIESLYTVEPLLSFSLVSYLFFARGCKALEVYWQSKSRREFKSEVHHSLN